MKPLLPCLVVMVVAGCTTAPVEPQAADAPQSAQAQQAAQAADAAQVPQIEQAAQAARAPQHVTLLSRSGHQDYDQATFSFDHDLHLDPKGAVTRNNWDLEFGNGGDMFGVTMVTDDRSRIVDLGELSWEALLAMDYEIPEPHAVPTREPAVPVHEGHVYIVRTADQWVDLVALVRVESLAPGDRVEFTYLVISKQRTDTHPLGSSS